MPDLPTPPPHLRIPPPYLRIPPHTSVYLPVSPQSPHIWHLGDQQPELAVADDCHAVLWRDDPLLRDAKRGGERLGERRVLRRDAVRHGVQVDDGEGEPLAVGPVLVEDAKHGPLGAVVARPRAADGARAARRRVPAAEVDVADDALADEVGVRGGRRLDDADKLVANDA